jgi:hypothetical protein
VPISTMAMAMRQPAGFCGIFWLSCDITDFLFIAPNAPVQRRR